MKSKLMVIFFVLFVSANYAFTQQVQTGKSNDLVEKYITAFNGGEETMRAFLTENISQASLEQRPVEARLSMYRQMHANMEELTLKQIQGATAASISALMHTKKDEWFLFTFELEPEPPHKIVGIRIEDTDAPESAYATKTTEIEALKTIVQLLSEQSKNDLFSGSVLIAAKNKPILKRSFGMANKEFKFKNTPETKFNLGSINKIFTQIAIGQLYEQGKLSFNDPIIKFLPDYPNKTAAEKVTIRHLLDMSSGVGDFFGEKFESTPKDRFRAIGDFLPMFAGDSLKFEPGTQRQYSNGGFIVLGAIIEKASGQSYYDYVKEHIFKCAGMSNTDSYEADIPVPNLAEGYTRASSNQPWRKNIYTRPARGSSAGGGYSTVEGLLKFTIALERKMFFKNAETWNTLRNQPSGQGNQQPGGMGIFGGAPGINSGIETNIGNGYTAIVMSNYDPPAAENILKKIRGILKRVK
jgi:CubicO group peptidase (beta-lactamase class C family)